MDLKDIIAISGQPGLYKLVSQGKSILVAEHLLTGKRMPVHGSSQVSSLEEIAVFTDQEDKPLKEILFDIHESEQGKPAPDPKKSGPSELMAYFAGIVPDYDRTKVYLSDIRKIIGWYNILTAYPALVWEKPVREEQIEESADGDSAA